MTGQTNELRERLKDLNTKAYYLLVALAFIYSKNDAGFSLIFAITLTGLVAVLPLQDYAKADMTWLRRILIFKVIALTLALSCTVWWLWAVRYKLTPCWGIIPFVLIGVLVFYVALRFIPTEQPRVVNSQPVAKDHSQPV